MKIGKLTKFLQEIATEEPFNDQLRVTEIDIHADGKGVTVYTEDGNAHMLAVAPANKKGGACGIARHNG